MYVCAENAAEVAEHLADITNNELSNEEVGVKTFYFGDTSRSSKTSHCTSLLVSPFVSSPLSLQVAKVVTKVQELVNVAKINTSLAFTVVTIISNVMTSSETVLASASER